jgi:hypothetical protein
VTCQRIARQRLDKHPAIRARKNWTNVYSSFLGNSQRANELAGQKSSDVFFGRSASRVYRGQQRSFAGSSKVEE